MQGTPETVGSETPRLLIIDDSPLEREQLRRLLETHGYRVECADDGREGLERTERFRPDLVLCDWVMPEMDGTDFCRAVKKNAALRETYVALMSTRGASDDRVAGLDAGADDYVVKPVDGPELLARVRAGLRTRHLQRELSELVHRNAVLQMATTLGHEINNPLTALYGHLELLRQYIEADDQRRIDHHLEEAGRVATRIRDVARRLIHLSEVRTTNYMGRMSMIDLD